MRRAGMAAMGWARRIFWRTLESPGSLQRPHATCDHFLPRVTTWLTSHPPFRETLSHVHAMTLVGAEREYMNEKRVDSEIESEIDVEIGGERHR